jgi:hypothetical protein
MKKLFPEMPDVPQNVANRAVRIIEKHLKTHRVARARDLPEEARIRLYRDLRFFFDSENRSPDDRLPKKSFSLRGALSSFWEKLEDFLSACESGRLCSVLAVAMWPTLGESALSGTPIQFAGPRLCAGSD